MTYYLIIAILVLCIVVIIGGIIYTSLIKQYGFTVLFTFVLMMYIITGVQVYKAYDLPHHGINPRASDVKSNEAHIDTIYYIMNGDTIYMEEIINWN